MLSERFQHKKSLGQHFLTSDIVPGWMCSAGNLHSGDIVLEIGPGTGALTKVLLERGALVVALEADARALTILEKTFTAAITTKQLTLIHTDVRTLDLGSIPQINAGQYKVIANIPYYLSGFLFRTFLETSTQPSDLVFLVQKEVAKRITTNFSRGEKHSLLSLSTQVYGTTTYIKTVTRGHFNPPPNVDSGIVAISHISKQRFTTCREVDFFTLLHLGFAQKRKQLLGNLAAVYPRDRLISTFAALAVPTNIRAEDVALETWLGLTATLHPQAISST